MARLSSCQRRVRDVLKMFLHHHTMCVKAALHRKNKAKCTLTCAGFAPGEITALASVPPPVAFDTLSINMTSGSEPGDISSVGSDVSSLSSGTNSKSSDDW
ncbi:hypothetical protein B0H17DRAFT_1142373 [Mycena rosella]|uniref:Uncharacterized protein n=1 Tax=Mycena rosella TaxID=1033263 RepID=A0AAD7G9G3_MYCRO|nr:hypothetical protein B0H17DRAFT_1142373 [Mycena rosella]